MWYERRKSSLAVIGIKLAEFWLFSKQQLPSWAVIALADEVEFEFLV